MTQEFLLLDDKLGYKIDNHLHYRRSTAHVESTEVFVRHEDFSVSTVLLSRWQLGPSSNACAVAGSIYMKTASHVY